MLASVAYLTMLQAKPAKLAPAVFADDSTRRIVNLSRRAFDNLKSAKVTISVDGDSKRYSFSGGRIAGHQKGAQWAWGNKRLNLVCNKGFFRGTMGAYGVNAWLTSVGARPEVLPIQLAMKQNPVEVLVVPGSRVRRAGTMALGGVAVDLIEVKSDRLRVTMAIRQDNRLFADLTAVNVDKDGRVLFQSSRTFQWSLVNQAIPSTDFSVAAGKTPKPIKVLEANPRNT